MENQYKPNPQFMISAVALLQAIAHECDCNNCQTNRNNAFGALLWLIANHTRVNVDLQEIDGDALSASTVAVGESVGDAQATGAGVPAITKAMRDMVEARLGEPGLSAKERAVMAGWLEVYRDGE